MANRGRSWGMWLGGTRMVGQNFSLHQSFFKFPPPVGKRAKSPIIRHQWELLFTPWISLPISGNCYSNLGFPFPSTHRWISHQLTVGFVIVIQLPGTIDDLFCLSCVCKLVLELGKMFFEVFSTDSEMLSFLNSLWKVSLVVGFFFGGSSHKVHNKFSSC